MSTTGGSAPCEGMYSKLIDDDMANYDEMNPRPDVGHTGHRTSPVRVDPKSSRLGLYRLISICLAALCVILLISIISMSAHYKNKAQASVDEASASSQKLDANMTALMESINKLQQENKQLQKKRDELQKDKDELQMKRDELQKDKDELLAKLSSTKAPVVIKPTQKSTSAPIVCPVDWHLFNSSCYFVSRNTRDWPESKSYCESKGAYLAMIHTAEEQKFVWDLLPRGHWNAFWFGITDEHTEDQWKWVDGSPLVGGFWEEGEPNNHIDEDCGYIVKTRVLERVAIRSWYDAPCSMYWRFICEKEMGLGVSTAIPH
ncbi:asialoglycoprotein receptor 1-like [Gouania willdenowi]|uniref:Asialoglycoprotein receptor 1-like n=1 Tax=Gouania willdenowi TaxID=441366 RepID=A0A8C5ETH2_GOUWI|nr:asialoglycoprotein receptor 1-like [Gouania willdenowi]